MTELYLAVALTFACAAIIGAGAGTLTRLLPPATAVVTLTVGAIVVSLSSLVALALLAVGALGRNASLAHVGHWSDSVLRTAYPVPMTLSHAALVAVSLLITYAIARAVRSIGALVLANRAGRRLGDGSGCVVVIESAVPDAYALPGSTGRVIVSTAMLATLAPGERRVLLAHERSHLAHRHHIYVQLADTAAAINPLLRPVVGAVRSGTERWADEDAAVEVGDRRLAATALARAGLARARVRRTFLAETAAVGAMHGADENVADRARALLQPPPRGRRLLVAGVLTLAALSLAISAESTSNVAARFDRAQDSCASHCSGW